MLLLLCVVVVLVAATMILEIRVPGRASAPRLGSMSGRWLAEHRGSRSA